MVLGVESPKNITLALVKELPDYNTSWQMVSLKEPVEEEVITW
jgi:hypothetical protein